MLYANMHNVNQLEVSYLKNLLTLNTSVNVALPSTINFAPT
jgi:hypothetical protein